MTAAAPRRMVSWELVHVAGRLVLACRRHQLPASCWAPIHRALESDVLRVDPPAFESVVRETLDELATRRMLPAAVATAMDRVRAALPRIRPQ